MSHLCLSLSIFKTINLVDIYKLLIYTYKNIRHTNLYKCFKSYFGYQAYLEKFTLRSCGVYETFMMNCDICLQEYDLDKPDLYDDDNYDKMIYKKITEAPSNGVNIRYDVDNILAIIVETICYDCYYKHIGHFDVSNVINIDQNRSKMLS
jgi:hypothetical protein